MEIVLPETTVITRQKGFVALLDVLGFSRLVSGDNSSERLNGYLQGVKIALDASDLSTTVSYVIFSDSIVLTAEGDELPAFKAIARACSKVYGTLLTRDIALRGAIAFGTFTRQKSDAGVFIAGTSIIEAYHFEQLQDWVGIMIAPSVVDRFQNIGELCSLKNINNPENAMALFDRIDSASFIQPAKIPFHKSEDGAAAPYSGFAIVPTFQVPTKHDPFGGVAAAFPRLKRLRSTAPTPQAQAKYSAAIEWLRGVEKQMLEVSNWLESHAIYRSGAR